MHTFAQQHQPPERALGSLPRAPASAFAVNRRTDPLPHPHSTIGGNALEPVRSAHAGELAAGSSTAPPRVAFDFSRIPISSAAAPDRQLDFTRSPLPLPIQRTPAINVPGDAYEREADDVADRVMRTAPSAPISATGEVIKPACDGCGGEDRKRLLTKPAPAMDADATLDAGVAASAIERGGTSLPSEVRSFFEPRFGYDFSGVRVHTDSRAADGAHAIRARAYTLGRDIAFAPREYAPATVEGRRLLAHELAHVVQQGHARRIDGSRPQVAESRAVISRQPASPEETTGKPRTAEDARRELKARLKKDIPCLDEPVDDTKARCQFSKAQSSMLRLVRQRALRDCTTAIAAINMPGNEDRVKELAKDYFHLNIKLSDQTRRALIRTIKAISEKLEHAAIECGTCQDEHCNRGLIAYARAKTDLILCPPFFISTKVHLASRSLLHEAGHLAGVNTPTRDELYCHMGATREDKCPVVDAIRNADAWAYFIDAVAGTI